MQKEPNIYLVPAIASAVQIMNYLQDAGAPKMLTEICDALEIPKSSGLNMTRTLVHFGFLHYDEETRRFFVGPALIGLGATAANARGYVAIAHPHLITLAHETRLTSALAQHHPQGHVFLDKVESVAAIRITIQLGYPYHPFTGAPGKAYLATMHPGEVDRLWHAQTVPTVVLRQFPTLQSYECELMRVREAGYATSIGEHLEGVNAIAAPVLLPDQSFLTISLIGPAGALPPEQMPAVGQRLSDVAAAVSAEMGGKPGLLLARSARLG